MNTGAVSCLNKYDNAVGFYLNELKYNGVSKVTLSNYEKRLALFRNYWVEYHGGNPLSDPSAHDFESWRNSMMESGMKASSVAQYLKELRFFFSYVSDPELGEMKIYNENPVYKRLTPKIQQRPYDELLTSEQIAKLFVEEKPKGFGGSKYWSRNYAIVVLILTSGLRNEEVLRLKEEDIDWDNEEIIVENGKGGKYRVIDFDRTAQSALTLYYLSGLRPVDLPSDAPLFGTLAENKFGGRNEGCEWHEGSSQWLSSLVERHVYAVTGVHNIRTHDLRHICARLDLTGGMGIEMLQGKLGHSSPNITQIYSGRLTARRQMRKTSGVVEEKNRQTVLMENKIEKTIREVNDIERK